MAAFRLDPDIAVAQALDKLAAVAGDVKRLEWADLNAVASFPAKVRPIEIHIAAVAERKRRLLAEAPVPPALHQRENERKRIEVERAKREQTRARVDVCQQDLPAAPEPTERELKEQAKIERAEARTRARDAELHAQYLLKKKADREREKNRRYKPPVRHPRPGEPIDTGNMFSKDPFDQL